MLQARDTLIVPRCSCSPNDLLLSRRRRSMASRDNVKRNKPSTTLPYFAAVLALSIVLLLLSPLRSPPAPSPQLTAVSSGRCNYSSSTDSGAWIRSRDPVTPRYDHSCKEIYKGWSCAGKSNRGELHRWIWKPSGCPDPLPQLDPHRFLGRFRNTNIGFVGDSLNRNMFVSLVCMLRHVAVGGVKKWRPARADRGFTFLGYNLTVAYHRTNLLARYGRWSASVNGGDLESLGYKQGYRVDVDVPDQTWAKAPSFHDILVFNTGHWWWAPSKFNPIESPMLFFENGTPVLPPVPPELGLDLTLKHMISYINKNTRAGAIKLFRTQSPRHFEGGDWNQGGSCRRVQPLSSDEVEELFSLDNNGTNVETRLVNQHLYEALKGSSFQILDVTHLSEFRADAHPSTTGGKKHEDCMHWCLPGLTDTWNDLLAAHLENM